jgi:hypothetical protein
MFVGRALWYIDLITAEMLKELPQEGLLNLMYILNAIIRLEYWPKSLKQAQIIILPKPGKNRIDVTTKKPTAHNFKSTGETNTQKDQ